MGISVEQQIRDYVQQNFLFGNPINFGDEDSFLGLGIIDSTGVLELVAFVQDTYQFSLEDEDIIPENLDSVQNLAAFIKRRTQTGVSLQDTELAEQSA
jgi:acyl carrier protein